MNIIIRERVIEDVNEFCEFLSKLDHESKYMLFESGERNISKDVILNNIKKVINNGDICYVAIDNDKIIGYVIAVKDQFIRTQHIATIVIGILEEYCSNGIGYSLFQYIIKWAKGCNVKKLELTVITENKRAIYLYRKFGFEIEGTRKISTLIDGKYYDEYYMAKTL